MIPSFCAFIQRGLRALKIELSQMKPVLQEHTWPILIGSERAGDGTGLEVVRRKSLEKHVVWASHPQWQGFWSADAGAA